MVQPDDGVVHDTDRRRDRRVLGAALLRARHEDTLRANVSMIERLNARLEADNVCLKEDIKTFHDFDEIVGESAVGDATLSRRLAQVAPSQLARCCCSARPGRARSSSHAPFMNAAAGGRGPWCG